MQGRLLGLLLALLLGHTAHASVLFDADGECAEQASDLRDWDTTDWTIEGYFKGSADVFDNRSFITFNSAGSFGGGPYLEHGATDRMTVDDSAGEQGTWNTRNEPDTATWFHVAFVHQNSPNDCLLYINGSVISEDTACSLNIGGASTSYVLGNDFDCPGSSAEESLGYWSEVRLWTVERTAAQISDHSDCRLACTDGTTCPANLFARYAITETSGTTLDDDTAAAADLTITAATLEADDPTFGDDAGRFDGADCVSTALPRRAPMIFGALEFLWSRLNPWTRKMV